VETAKPGNSGAAAAGEGHPKRLWAGVALVLVLLAGVVFLISYLLRPSFVLSWPEMTESDGVVTVAFTAQNRTSRPLSRSVRVSLIVKQQKRSHGVKMYDIVEEKRVTLELEPGEEKPFSYDFPKPARSPVSPMVELMRP